VAALLPPPRRLCFTRRLLLAEISWTLRDEHFFYNLAHICRKKLIGSLWNCYHRCSFGQGSPHYILQIIWIWTADPECGSGPDLPWRRSTLSECCCYRKLLRSTECQHEEDTRLPFILSQTTRKHAVITRSVCGSAIRKPHMPACLGGSVG